MILKGKKLEFISFIKRDGTGTIMCGGEWDYNSNMFEVIVMEDHIRIIKK